MNSENLLYRFIRKNQSFLLFYLTFLQKIFKLSSFTIKKEGYQMTVQLHIQYLPHYSTDWEKMHYKNPDDSGFDLRAAIAEPMILKAHAITLVPCGIKVKIINDDATPYFYELQVRARSGLATKHGIGVANGPGTVDFGYRGEIKVALINFSDTDFVLEPGDRIAQAVICPVIQAHISEIDVVSDDTSRGSGGFGSTGKK